MDSERWATLSPLLDELLELDPEFRPRRLAEIRAADAAMADELERLLALEDQRPDFLSGSVVDAAVFAPQPGQVIGPYKLERLLGEGGMGQVWLAIRNDGLYQRRVALKLLRPGLGDTGLRQRFNRERQILARLGHAHIARLLDAGVSKDGQPYLALDYVQGEPITHYAWNLDLPVAERLQLFLQVCAAVSHAHANLVVHRDLKPSNILVTPAGEVCLLDFGIAKLLDEEASGEQELTGTGARTFTLHYAAPEQLRHGAVTTMTDVYSLGMVLYELLTGRKPYETDRATDAAWEEAILHADPVRPSQAALRQAREDGRPHARKRARELAGDLDNILLKALAKLPDERYVSAEALAQDIRRHLEGEPVLARPQSLAYRTGKFLRRNSLPVAGVSVVGMMLVAALVFVTWQARRAIEEAQRAQAMQDFVVALFEDTEQTGSGDAVDVRSLLDAGARRADTDLHGQPRARAELLGLLARLRQGLGDDREALALLDRQARLFAAMPEDDRERLQVEAAALRGRSLRALGQADACVAELKPLLSLSQQLAVRWPRASAEFLSQLGRCHRALGGRAVARDLFGQALQLRGAGGELSKPLQAESQADLAGLLMDEGRYAEALDGMYRALGLLRESVGDRNALGVEVWRELGQLQRALGDRREAEASYRQGLQIALDRFGVGHPLTIGVQRALGDLLIEVGKLEEAGRLLGMAHQRLSDRLGPDHGELARSWRQLGRLAYEQGRLPQAADALQRSLDLHRRHGMLAADPALLCDLARVQSAQGLHAAAEALARECLQLAQAASPTMAAEAERLMVWLALARQDGTAARDWLALAERRGDGGEPRVQGELARLRIKLALADDDLPAAEAALATLRALPLPQGTDIALRTWRSDALLAELHCRAGRAGTGRELIEATLAAVGRQAPERQRLLDELAADAGSCGRR
ncbi:serine/threonine-protein kinase [Arenimonas fontis]|uniref:Protein kinase n=1 Tax=Arenimonas fontis TaxID=2608255 RepID=A0A5B2Z9A3_9GAMM|nr:serine/threonine-protein kinase [Arenimonas fontis]KAA2284726.1 protein kinase [Arenimonas fontis]